MANFVGDHNFVDPLKNEMYQLLLIRMKYINFY